MKGLDLLMSTGRMTTQKSGSGSGKSGKTGSGHFFQVVYQMKVLGLLIDAEWSDPFFRINRFWKSGKRGLYTLLSM